MNQKTLVIAVVVVVVVAAVVAGVYLATQSGGPTPTPTPTVTPSGSDVAGASSLQFSVDITSGGVSQGTYTYMAKNIGTSSMMIRIEMSNGYDVVDIVNGAQKKAWEYSDGEWHDFSDAFELQWDAWNSTWVGYRDNLAGWTGVGDKTYTAPNGDSVRVYAISVNPSLADSLFEPS